MIAALGMYDMGPLQGANDRFWTQIQNALGYGPDRLTRDRDFWEIWQSPDLLFAQTCGLPFRIALHDKVQLVGTPDYGLPDCPPGYYRSVMIARADDPRESLNAFTGTRFAFNEARSQSGWAAPMVHLRTQEITPGLLFETGTHAASATAVAEGRADFAGIDALTWELLRSHTALPQKLRVIEATDPTPGLPYITSPDQSAADIARAVEHAIANLDTADREALHLKGLCHIPAQTYRAITTPPGPEAYKGD